MSTQVVEYDTAAAERRAERIRLRLDSIADNYTAVMPMIREAIEKRDDLALGYRSVSEYVADRFGGALKMLGIEVRREVVRELTAAGMSTRAIAPVVGVGSTTVKRDVQVVHADHLTDDLSHATAGEEVTSAEETPTSADAEAVADEGRVEADAQPLPPAETPRPPATVTGIDGKTYTKKPSKPKSPPRRPLPDQFFDAAFDMGKAIEKVARITEDDRFPQNAEKVAAKHRNDLIRSRDLLQQVIDRLA